MTRRLVVLMVGLVAATLIIAGLGTLVLANVRARADTEDDLRTQAFNTAANLALFFDESDGDELTEDELQQRLRNLTLLRRVVDLDGFAVLGITPDGGFNADELPEGVDGSMLDIAALQDGALTSGNDGDLVFAAAPLDLPRDRTGVIVLSQQANAGLGPAARYFVLAAIASALLGLLAAIIVGRRVTRPIRAATAATTRIAAGELDTRLPTPSGRSGDELVDLSRHVNEMAETLERSRALEQQFLLSVSHDLRTPLTSIRGYAEAISDGAGDPRRAAGVITSEARRLERLVADLLDLAKLQAATFSLQLERVDLGQLAAVAVEGFEPDAADRGLMIRALDARYSPVGAGRSRPAGSGRSEPDRERDEVRSVRCGGAHVGGRLVGGDDSGRRRSGHRSGRSSARVRTPVRHSPPSGTARELERPRPGDREAVGGSDERPRQRQQRGGRGHHLRGAPPAHRVIDFLDLDRQDRPIRWTMSTWPSPETKYARSR